MPFLTVNDPIETGLHTLLTPLLLCRKAQSHRRSKHIIRLPEMALEALFVATWGSFVCDNLSSTHRFTSIVAVMFGTLHWNPHNKEPEFVERLHGSSNPEKYSACDRCRAKKVALSGSASHIGTLILTSYICRSNVVPMTTDARDASAWGNRALSVQ